MPDVHSPGHTQETKVVWPGGASKQGPHRVGAFATCAQLEAFGYDLMLQPNVEKDAPVIGTLVHVGMAYRYGMLLPKPWPTWLVYPDARTALWTCGYDRPDLAREALRIFDSYCAHYDRLIQAGIVRQWRPIYVEHQFEVPFPMPDGTTEPYTARVDLIAYDGDDLLLIDHKFGGKLSYHYGTVYRSDRQMLTCLALARAHGCDIKRVVMNVGTREYPESRFGRFEVPVSAEAYGRLGAETQYVLERMHDVRARFPDPTNRPRTFESCIRKYGPCNFKPVCEDGLHRLAEYSRRT